MLVFYLRRRQAAGLALLAFLALALGLGLHGYRQEVIASGASPGPLYRGNPLKPMVALTFNVDWGEEFLPPILEALDREKVKATFFLTGRWAEQNPRSVKEIAERGHLLGNHGYAHAHPDQLGVQDNKAEIQKAEEVIRRLTGINNHFFAPPYGERGKAMLQAAEELGYVTVLWTVDAVDWREGRTAEEVVRKVMVGLQNGALILLHPTRATAQALPELLHRLKEAGYSPGTVPEVLEGTS